MPAEPSVLEQVKSCGSVSCLINMEPSELLRLQPSERIASESVDMDFTRLKCYKIKNRPPPRNCPQTPTDYRHTDKHIKTGNDS